MLVSHKNIVTYVKNVVEYVSAHYNTIRCMQIKLGLHGFFLGSSFQPPPLPPGGSSFTPWLPGLEWREFFINNSKSIKGIRLIFSWLIEVHKVYLQCKEWLSSCCSFCVIMNSFKNRHSRPGRRYSSQNTLWKIIKKCEESPPITKICEVTPRTNNNTDHIIKKSD